MERESVRYKQAEYLQDKIGKVFDGLISGISKWGIYVELKDSKCEGMVRFSTLDDMYYIDEENFRVVGQETRQIYRLGDAVKVRVEAVDLIKKQMDFTLVQAGKRKQSRHFDRSEA